VTAGDQGGTWNIVDQVRDQLVNPLTGLRILLEDLVRAGGGTATDLHDALDVVDRIDGELDRSLEELRHRLDGGPAS
jgi:hypothetical protein